MSIPENQMRLGILIALMLLATSSAAQQTVYKWVDEDGVVHFGESPPEGVDAERITTDAPPPAPPSRPVPAATESGVEPAASSPPVESAPAETPAVASPPASEMTLAELDQRCDQAREAKIAPLRAAEIERCKAQPRSDPEFCERHNADFGEGGRTVTGAIRPRMFDDLPECVEALEERNRRSN